jgi:hypothetical protein
MVALDEDFVIGALEIVSPMCNSIENRQGLPILRMAGLFGGAVCPRVQIDWAKNHESVILVKDAGDCVASCIGLQNDRLFRVKMQEDRCFGKGHFEPSNCEFGIPSPYPLP